MEVFGRNAMNERFGIIRKGRLRHKSADGGISWRDDGGRCDGITTWLHRREGLDDEGKW